MNTVEFATHFVNFFNSKIGVILINVEFESLIKDKG